MDMSNYSMPVYQTLSHMIWDLLIKFIVEFVIHVRREYHVTILYEYLNNFLVDKDLNGFINLRL